MTPQEIAKVQAYMRKTFANPRITLKRRAQKDDSVEVIMDDAVSYTHLTLPTILRV